MRLGTAGVVSVLWRGRFPNATVVGISGHPWAVLGAAFLVALAAIGLATPASAGLLALAMACTVVFGWHEGQQFVEEPVRGLMLAVLYGALALTGAGRWSLDQLIASRWAAAHELSRVGAPYSLGSRQPPWGTDLGLLLLRLGTGLSLFSLFGVTKVGWVITQLQSPEPWSHWAFAKLIAAVGFPVPFLLSIGAVLNETLTPLLVAAGLATRVAASIGAVGFGGAFYTSIRLGEEPLRAATYLVAFATIAFTGAGRHSLDMSGLFSGRDRTANLCHAGGV